MTAGPVAVPHDLEVAEREAAGVGPEFELRGQTFRCVPKLPWSLRSSLIAFAASMSGDDVIEMLVQIGPFFDGCLREDDQERRDDVPLRGTDSLSRFRQLAARKVDPIDEEDLVPIIEQLIPAYTARPTKQPLDSPRGSSSTTRSSTGGSLPDGMVPVASLASLG